MIKYFSNHTGKEIDDAIDGIPALQKRVTTNETNIEKNTTDIATNKADIEKNTTDIATNKANIEKNAYDIKTNSAQISAVVSTNQKQAASISENTTTIEQNTTDIATNKANIEQNTAGIAQNATSISDIQKIVCNKYFVLLDNGTLMFTGNAWYDEDGRQIGDTYLSKANAESNYLKKADEKAVTVSPGDHVTVTKSTDGNTTDYKIAARNTIVAGVGGITTDLVKGTEESDSPTYQIRPKLDDAYVALDNNGNITLSDTVKTILSSTTGGVDLTELKSSVSANTSDIETLKTDVRTNASDIEANKASVSALSTTQAMHTTTLTELTQKASMLSKDGSTYGGTAAKAEQDTDGNTITTTYATKDELKANAGSTISVYENTADTYRLKITAADGTSIITPNLMGKSSGETPSVETSVVYSCTDYSKYLDSVYVYNAYRASQSLTTPESLQSTIDNSEKVVASDHAIDINQTDFGWANLALIINTAVTKVSSTEMILTTANVNGSATEKIYFIPKSLVTATAAADIAKSISTLLTAETVDSSILTVDNSLIHTGGNPLTVAVKLTGIADGDYYIALSAHSDNSKPIYYNIWLQE